MMTVAIKVQATIFGAYALRLDRLAAIHLLRTARYLSRNTFAVDSAAAGLFHFAKGLL